MNFREDACFLEQVAEVKNTHLRADLKTGHDNERDRLSLVLVNKYRTSITEEVQN
jgi:hypothetical protein